MINLKPLRELRLSADGRDWISAASGLVVLGPTAYVVADDELSLASFALADLAAPGTRLRLLQGELPLGHAERKAAKPDLEALVELPSSVEWPEGALLAVPSGSGPKRMRGALVPLAAGGRTGSPEEIDFAPLLGGLAERIHELNVEGAAVVGDRLRLFHRGNGTGSFNATADLDLAAFAEGLAARSRAPAGALVEWRRHELGTIDGVALTFTDACHFEGGCLFAAAAEATASTYDDGPCLGSALGRMDAAGRIEWIRRLSPVAKFEGVHAGRISPGRIEILAVTDADDPSRPASLYRGGIEA